MDGKMGWMGGLVTLLRRFQMFNQQHSWLAYGIAGLLTATTLLLRITIVSAADGPPAMVVLVIPIILSAYAGGLGPGLFSTAVAALGANYFLLPPRNTFSIPSGLHAVQWLALIAAGVLISVLTESLHRGHRRLEASLAERRRVEQTVRENEMLMTGIIGSAMDGIITVDTDQRITLFNTAAEKMFGYTANEMMGQPLGRLIPENFRTAHSDHIRDFIRTHTTHRTMNTLGTVRGVRSNGKEFPLEVSISLTEIDGRASCTAILRDITGRKEVENFLVENESRLRRAQAMAHVGNWEFDLRTQQIWSSAEARMIYGIESETEFVPLRLVRQCAVPQDQPRLDEALQSLITQGKEYNERFQIRRQNTGELRFVHSKAERELDTAGNPVRVIGVLQDITEQEIAERALRESEESFRALFTAMIEGVALHQLVYDQNGTVIDYRIMDVNPAYEEKMGISAEKARGSLASRIYGLGRAPYLHLYTKVAQTGGSHFFETYFPPLDSYFEISVFSPRKDWFATVIMDVTRHKRAEEALRQSEERFRTTLYSIGDGVITTDITGSIVQMNRVAETLTGWNEAEAHGKPIQEVFRILDDESRMVENPVRRVLNEGVVVGLADRTVLVGRDGTHRPISESSAPIKNSAGETTGVVLVFDDQSERKELEAQLAQAQKMEAIGRLAGGVAHDFNNMIGVILGYASLMEKRLNPADPLLRHVQTITSAAQKSGNLTRQLLAFARKQIIAPVPLNLNDSLASLQRMLARLIGEDITLRIVPHDNLWNVRIDPTQVDQVLANLATNARDAIENVGTITIETANVVVDKSYIQEHLDVAPGEFVMLAFTDTGKGMDRATQRRIFEPFFTTKPEGVGTGLGLATVFGIVKQNSGFINVYSEPGKGTTFKICFPRFYGEAEIAAERPMDVSCAGTETILIVEDEEQLLYLAKSALEVFGYTVFAAKSPGDAILLCEQTTRKIDVLISDVVMPGMNGKDLKERLDTIKQGMKTIYMSGYTADFIAHRGILDEGVDFISKPFSPDALAQKVRSVLDKREADEPLGKE